jgi:hypothetical protein
MGGVTSGWFVVYVGDEVKDRSVVAHDKANGRWELQGSMRRDKLGDMGHGTFGVHEVERLL